ncbi:twin-arginine translocation signal domain-containing protein [Streptomyces stelliscabiei]|nr:twin-arginine translocation signal domain-containing protein [Streptomyces stelliscabiei]MDX2550256.1 twin-arginine translocation signal domain-containing protein [Streptomyces stelliscabiei]MDX2610445.1 twin-arginine translocation signal domain-containing protein [Streptomyces stelliscabiei]MDX2635466.1 twin-arginine translocation signal domain-containing protein [Streptomyces stelliscabiei]MDX2665739.1 twin-arginine translocation signal domain-containing protein [Streptomyces stelliscabiei
MIRDAPAPTRRSLLKYSGALGAAAAVSSSQGGRGVRADRAGLLGRVGPRAPLPLPPSCAGAGVDA